MKSWARLAYVIVALAAMYGLVYLQLKQQPLIGKQHPAYATYAKPKDFCYRKNESTIVFLHFWSNHSYRYLNTLEICAARTAALRNPNSGICMLMDAEPEDLPEALQSLPNFQWALLDYPLLLEGSPIENDGPRLMAGTKNSKNGLLERSDLVRLLYIHKYGGKYLDTDWLVLKSLEGLRNITGSENGQIISGGVMMFDAGNEFIADALQLFPKRYRPGVWSSGGPVMLTEVFWRRWSNSTTVVQFMPISQFFPIHYCNASAPFLAEHYEWCRGKCRNSYMVHLWRHMITDIFVPGYTFDRRSYVGRLLVENGCL